MERQAYNFLVQAEHSWWYIARRRFIERMLNGTPKVEGPALDFGAGFGACHPLLAQYCSAVDAFEMDTEALRGCATRGYRTATHDWHKVGDSYALVGAFDVIEHLGNDVLWLRDIYTHMQEGGTLALSVPAFPWMWSEHDVLHKHFRRYTKKSITNALGAAGFTVVRATYWNFFLFPVALVLRLLGKGGGDNLSPGAPVNWLLHTILGLESRLVPSLSLPWGTGIIVIAQKPARGILRSDQR